MAPEALSRLYVDDDGGPHGAEHRVGASWMTREDREAEIRDYVGYLDQLQAEIDGSTAQQRPATVLGFSQGAETASRWAVLGAARPPARLILWSGLLAHDLDRDRAAERLASVRVSYVLGSADRLVDRDALAAQRRWLEAGGVASELVTFDGGHVILPDPLRRIATE